VTKASIISLRGVSKKYHLYDSLSHRVYEALHPFKKKYHREFWALRDIDLDIPAGATVGILGVNGSGKSTLLQILCSILQPTSGTVAVRGKVAALIELGAGFNPELTGRENAELNCTILGLDRGELRTKLPQIEAFADIGEFFDQPVKTYSSGMFMRVAFATAASAEPDILVIDEALAVGDARFQQKCFRKFRDFQAAGKTILLVTHDRSVVPRLCTYGLLLHQGRLLRSGTPKDVTDHYSYILTHGDTPQQPDSLLNEDAFSTPASPSSSASDPSLVRHVPHAIESFCAQKDPTDRCQHNTTYNKNEFCYGLGGAAIVNYLISANGVINPVEVECGTSVEIYIRVRFDRQVDQPLVGLCVKTRDGTLVYGTHSGWLKQQLSSGVPGMVATYKFTLSMDLGADDWFFDLAVSASQTEILHAREAVLHVRSVSTTMSTGFVSLRAQVAEIGNKLD
jgi:lipopolysaccharide transport system ATP-binding protein